MPKTGTDPQADVVSQPLRVSEYMQSVREDAERLRKAGVDTGRVTESQELLNRAVSSMLPHNQELAKEDAALVEKLWTSLRANDDGALSEVAAELQKHLDSARDECKEQADAFKKLANQNPSAPEGDRVQQLSLYKEAEQKYLALKEATEAAKTAESLSLSLSKAFAQAIVMQGAKLLGPGYESYKPRLSQDKSRIETYCNMFVDALAGALYGEKLEGDVPAQIKHLKDQSSTWRSTTSKEEAMKAAERGYLVLAVDNGSHISVVVRPDVVPADAGSKGYIKYTRNPVTKNVISSELKLEVQASGTFVKDHKDYPNSPSVMQAGGRPGYTTLEWAFRKPDIDNGNVRFYIRQDRRLASSR